MHLNLNYNLLPHPLTFPFSLTKRFELGAGGSATELVGEAAQ